MALTLNQATTEVRDVLNESTAVFWTDAQIQKWIQEGTRIFSSKTLMVEDTQDIDPLIAGQLSYSSSDETWIGNIIEPYAAIYNDGGAGVAALNKGLIKIHPRQIGNLALKTVGAPKYYCMHDRKIYIFPMTSAAIVAAGAKITFLFATETDDITALTDEYQHLPILYAVAMCKRKDQKFAEANALLGQFWQEISFERADKHARETDSLDKFKIPGTGGGAESARG
jgi:hypothetical protein